MTTFFTTSQTVNVSRLTNDGWWIENTTEHVAKGTALGSDFTVNIYTPSVDGMTARYDRSSDTWSVEIEDMTKKPYFDKNGGKHYLDNPVSEYPKGAILEAPPEYDGETQTVLYKDGKWKVYSIQIGQAFYGEYGDEFVVSDYNFELPENYTFTKPPSLRSDKYVVKLVNGEWQQLLDHRGQIAFAKNRDNDKDYQIRDLEELPDTHTLLEPKAFESWVNGGWQYDIERHRPFKVAEEKSWRDAELIKVLNRIDQYEKDQGYPLELRTSPIQSEDDYMRLLQDRKALSDYPESEHFPFGLRPLLSGLTR